LSGHHRQSDSAKERRNHRWDFFLENPHTMLHKRTCMRFLRFNLTVCCYCRYGTKYKKETSIYSNIADLQLKRCTRTHPCECVVNGCHPQQAQNGANAKGVPGTQKEVAQRVPKRLLRTLLESAKQHFSPQDMTRLYRDTLRNRPSTFTRSHAVFRICKHRRCSGHVTTLNNIVRFTTPKRKFKLHATG